MAKPQINSTRIPTVEVTQHFLGNSDVAELKIEIYARIPLSEKQRGEILEQLRVYFNDMESTLRGFGDALREQYGGINIPPPIHTYAVAEDGDNAEGVRQDDSSPPKNA